MEHKPKDDLNERAPASIPDRLRLEGDQRSTVCEELVHLYSCLLSN